MVTENIPTVAFGVAGYQEENNTVYHCLVTFGPTAVIKASGLKNTDTLP